MREMGWSFAELEDTPVYVRRYVWDLIRVRRQAQADADDRARGGDDG